MLVPIYTVPFTLKVSLGVATPAIAPIATFPVVVFTVKMYVSPSALVILRAVCELEDGYHLLAIRLSPLYISVDL